MPPRPTTDPASSSPTPNPRAHRDDDLPAAEPMRRLAGWARALFAVASVVFSVLIAVLGAYADVKSDVRDSRTVITEHGRRLDKQDELTEKMVDQLGEIRSDVQYIKGVVEAATRPR